MRRQRLCTSRRRCSAYLMCFTERLLLRKDGDIILAHLRIDFHNLRCVPGASSHHLFSLVHNSRSSEVSHRNYTCCVRPANMTEFGSYMDNGLCRGLLLDKIPPSILEKDFLIMIVAMPHPDLHSRMHSERIHTLDYY